VTLGVIALGIKHAKRIEVALEKARQDDLTLKGFFAADRSERFFCQEH